MCNCVTAPHVAAAYSEDIFKAAIINVFYINSGSHVSKRGHLKWWTHRQLTHNSTVPLSFSTGHPWNLSGRPTFLKYDWLPAQWEAGPEIEPTVWVVFKYVLFSFERSILWMVKFLFEDIINSRCFILCLYGHTLLCWIIFLLNLLNVLIVSHFE